MSAASGWSWYSAKKMRDQEAEDASEQLLGEERQVFTAAMEAIEGILDAAFAGATVEGLAEKAKAAIIYRSRDLLWSAWREMLAARYAAATEHWRSISESPHFIRAIVVKPDLAKQWMSGRLKVELAMKTERDRLRDAGHYKAAESWHRRTSQDASTIQRFSHVTIESAVATIPIAVSSEGQPQAFVVGGAVSREMARRIGLYLAYEAVVTLHTSAFAYQHLPAVSQLWDQQGESLYKTAIRTVEKVYDELGLAQVLADAAQGTEGRSVT